MEEDKYKYNKNCMISINYKDFELPDEILNAAKEEKLVLFCGSGISTEQKNVLPYSFYTSIQDELGISNTNLPFSETMQMYCNQPNGRRKLIKKIHERFQYIKSFPELELFATMFHRELADMYFIKTIITTNWDTYFEDYCSAIPITIPEDFVFWDLGERCVLKIHGSINNIGTIVATKEDYKKCEKNLERNIIGATLKTILANNTVVFIGFSFGDEDFMSILNYLKSELKDYLPHIYVVTIDETLEEKLNYINSTCIVTDGTYFLHKLKNKMIEDNYMENCGIISEIYDMRTLLNNYHCECFNIDINKYPELVYCIAYQDGIFHAFDRFFSMYSTGKYNIPNWLLSTIIKYNEIVDEKLHVGNYWDYSYFKGYMIGLMYILMCGKNDNDRERLPLYFLPNQGKDLFTFEEFKKELKATTQKYEEFYKYALELIGGINDVDIHHPPYSTRNN